MLNSQAVPPTTFTDNYSPPKTRHDVPKSFVRPEDAAVVVEEEIPEPPPPELIPADAADPDAETIGPGAFLGLAKLKSDDGGSSGDEDGDGTKAKLVDAASGPRLPPMPTVAPQPASFLPLLEELSPGLVQSLRSASNLQVA